MRVTLNRLYELFRRAFLRLSRRKNVTDNVAFLAHIEALARAEASATPFESAFISLIVPVFDTEPEYLDDLIASVRAQPLGSWELILSDDGSTRRATVAWLDRHAKAGDIQIVRSAQNLGIANATNLGLAAATAPWVAFLDHDDALAPYALDRIWGAIRSAPSCIFLYTDEIIADEKLRPIDFFLKPAYDPVLLSGVNYINHLSVYRRDRLLEVGGLRQDFEGSQDYDLLLRYTRQLSRGDCLHVPYPAYIWRRHRASYSARFIERATRNARRALAQAYKVGDVELPVEPAQGGDLHRIRFDLKNRSWPLVSIIIPNRDSFTLISRLLNSLMLLTDYVSIEIIVVDNGSKDLSVLDLYEHYSAVMKGFVAVVEEEEFNFSRSINKGVALSHGEFLLLLNNDVEIISCDWLKEMVACFDYPDVAVVGAKLLYPNRTLQHAGVIVGFGGLAGHWYLNQPSDFPGPMGRLWVRQSLSAVTGACLMISREAITRTGPLDEANFPIAYNDVDFCLRTLADGFRVVWTPFATLIHHESSSRGSDETPTNIKRFRKEQLNLQTAHMTNVYDDFAISPWYSKDRSSPGRIMLKSLPPPR